MEKPATPHDANERFTVRNIYLPFLAFRIALSGILTSSISEFQGKTIEFKDPRSGDIYGTEKSATPEEVNVCVAAAKKAQAEWAKTSFEERRLVLCDLLETILANRDDICTASMRDTGKTRTSSF